MEVRLLRKPVFPFVVAVGGIGINGGVFRKVQRQGLKDGDVNLGSRDQHELHWLACDCKQERDTKTKEVATFTGKIAVMRFAPIKRTAECKCYHTQAQDNCLRWTLPCG